MRFDTPRSLVQSLILTPVRIVALAAAGAVLGAVAGAVFGTLWGALHGAIHGDLWVTLALGGRCATAGAAAGALIGGLTPLIDGGPTGAYAQPEADGWGQAQALPTGTTGRPYRNANAPGGMTDQGVEENGGLRRSGVG
jgi:hypothetical protein